MANVSTINKPTVRYEFFFIYRKNGLLTELKEEKDCWNWAHAHAYFLNRCKDLAITGENIDSCSWHQQGSFAASALGGATSGLAE